MSLMLAIFITALIMISVCGIYGLIATRNLLRIIISLEVLTKAATLMLILSGYIIGRMALAQTFVITLIIIEVVVIVVAAGIVLSVHKRYDSLDSYKISNLKG